MLSNSFQKIKTRNLTEILQRPAIVVTVLIIVGFLIRVFVLQYRWINPDEGSYLMDARLILDGKIPIADYAARQPFFLYFLAATMKLFGVSLSVGRYIVLFSNLGIVFFVYKISEKIFDENVGIVAAAAYILMPFSIIWSASVMTEMPATFLACGSIYFLLRAMNGKAQFSYFLISGIFASLAFFVRQTAICLPAVIFIYLLVAHSNKKFCLRGLLLFFLGYLAICACVMVYYLQFLPIRDIFFSRLNPQEIILSKLFPNVYLSWSGVTMLAEPTQTTELTKHYLAEIAIYSLPFIIGCILSIYYYRTSKSLKGKRDIGQWGFFLLYLWIFVVFAMYALRTLERGIYSHYLTEILPPLIILFAFSLIKLLQFYSFQQRKIILVGLFVLYFGVYILQHKFWQTYLGHHVYLAGSMVLCTIAWIWQKNESNSKIRDWRLAILLAFFIFVCNKILLTLGISMLFALFITIVALYLFLFFIFRIVVPAAKNFQCLVVGLLLIFSLYFSAGQAGLRLGANYDGVWSLETLKQVTNYLRENGTEDQEVLAGCTIWAFQSGLHCAMSVTHPLAFQTMSQQIFNTQFKQRPPDYIIFDGYTIKNISSHIDFISKKIDHTYQKVVSIEGSRFPVEIYRFQDSKLHFDKK